MPSSSRWSSAAARLVESIEALSLRFDPLNDANAASLQDTDAGGASFAGMPIGVRFSRPIPDLPAFCEELFSSRAPFRLIRETDDCDRPVSAVIARVDQCESCPRPFSVSVRVTSTSTCSSVIFRVARGRGASSRPSSRRSMNRTRHLRTDSRDKIASEPEITASGVQPSALVS
jgi:hypothetical protein